MAKFNQTLRVPKVIKPGIRVTTTWANKKSHTWLLIDITNNQAYLKRTNGEVFSTHVNTLREPIN